MEHLQAIADGFGPSEEHIRVLEAYRREFGIPISLPHSTAAFNRAVDWWNAGAAFASQETPTEQREASTGEPGVLMLDCERPKGHDGDHRATYGWPQEQVHAPRESLVKPPTWLTALIDAQSRSYAADARRFAPLRHDVTTPREGDPRAQ